MFVVLGIPVLIAIILRLFGENTFVIPIYYEEGISNEECGIQSNGQYYVKNIQTIDDHSHSLKGDISLVYFHVEENRFALQMQKDFDRIFSTKLKSGLLNIYTITNSDFGADSIQDIPDFSFLQMEIEQRENLARCNLFIPGNEITQEEIQYSTAILIDSSGRIRGYYNGSEEKEIDRLSAEVDILLLEDDKD